VPDYWVIGNTVYNPADVVITIALAFAAVCVGNELRLQRKPRARPKHL